MPDYEMMAGSDSIPSALLITSAHAWVIVDTVPRIAYVDPLGSQYTRRGFASSATEQWKRRVFRNTGDQLPKCLCGRPPTFIATYLAPTDRQAALVRLLVVLDFFDQLCNIGQSRSLWVAVRKTCIDEEEFQARASSLIRVALMAMTGVEEQWNWPGAAELFQDVLHAVSELRRAVAAAVRSLPTAPSHIGIDLSILPVHIKLTTTEELMASIAEDEERSARRAWLEKHNAVEKEDCSAESEREATYDDLLSEAGTRMRAKWKQFWSTAASSQFVCELIEEQAATVKQAWDEWRTDEKFNVPSNHRDREVSYLTSSLLRYLNRACPTAQVADLVKVTVEVVQMAYGEDVEQRAFARLRRIRQ